MTDAIQLSKSYNGWFTENNIQFAFKNWKDALNEENLLKWTSKYDLDKVHNHHIAIVLAGNIPLVGFHDFLSVLISGNRLIAKLSSNDKLLLPYLTKYLIAIEPEFDGKIVFTEERLEKFDAVIATGSNNTARYFEYYFGKYPNIIRKNRNSVAVLSGKETGEELYCCLIGAVYGHPAAARRWAQRRDGVMTGPCFNFKDGAPPEPQGARVRRALEQCKEYKVEPVLP